MQEELNEFERNEVWKLVPRPKNGSIIGTKWVFRKKLILMEPLSEIRQG